jgi:hypothetical protein
MHLSTSSSNAPTGRHVFLLLLACALVCALIESGTAFEFARISRIEHRRETEYQRALDMHPAEHATSVLVAGNSLLLEGVDFPALQQQVGPEFTLRRFVVEGTFYLDWYYGLRRMFASGARPDAVVLVLNPTQLASSAIGGDYTTHFLVDKADLLQFASDAGADRNRISSMALANISFFYGARAEIRNWILGKVVPDLPSLTRTFRPGPKPPSAADTRELEIQRLQRLNQMCQEHGAELVFVVPPSNEDIGTSALVHSASTIGVRILVPIAPGVLAPSDYSDRFHLSPNGASKFTPALAAGLRQVLLASDSHHNLTTAFKSPSTAAHRLNDPPGQTSVANALPDRTDAQRAAHNPAD